jgi:hypothetical protein
MARKVWLPAELEKLTPAEQDALFEDSIVSDLNVVPQDFLAAVRDRVQQRIARTDTPNAR